MAVKRAALLLALLGALPALAQTPKPRLSAINASGGQRGATVELSLAGDGIAAGTGLVFDGDGLSVESVAPGPDNRLVAKVKIAADAAPGRRAFRVVTPTGLSDVGTFFVGQWPEVAEKEPNSTRAAAQSLTGPVTVLGRCDGEDVDVYRVALHRGETYVFEATPGGVGAPLEPVLTLQDAAGHDVGFPDPARRGGALLRFTAPGDGDYFLVLRDLRFQGGGQYLYRLTVGAIPYVAAVFPLGGPAGASIDLSLDGVNLPPAPTVRLGMPAAPAQARSFALPLAGALSNDIALDIDAGPETRESEPNDTDVNAQRVLVPSVVNGRLTGVSGKPDVDRFRFTATKGMIVELETRAARLGSKLDAVLTVRNAKGEQLATNDDGRGKDAYLEFTAPADGEYTVEVRDLLDRSGPEYGYRLRLAPGQPDFQLSFTPDCPAVGPGDRVPFRVAAVRRYGFAGEIALEVAGLPPGAKLIGEPKIPAGQSEALLLVATETAAPLAVSALRVTGRATIDGKPIARAGQPQREEYVRRDDRIDRTTLPSLLPLAAIIRPPDVILTAADRLELKVGQTAELTVQAQRKDGFGAKVPIVVVGLPPGVSAAAELPDNQKEVKLTFRAEGNATPGETIVLVIGRALTDELRFTEHAALPVRLVIVK